MRFSQWKEHERLVLSAYFTEYPLLFPVLGMTFTWNKVIVLLGTALAPLLVNAAVSAVIGPGSGAAPSKPTNSTL